MIVHYTPRSYAEITLHLLHTMTKNTLRAPTTKLPSRKHAAASKIRLRTTPLSDLELMSA